MQFNHDHAITVLFSAKFLETFIHPHKVQATPKKTFIMSTSIRNVQIEAVKHHDDAHESAQYSSLDIIEYTIYTTYLAANLQKQATAIDTLKGPPSQKRPFQLWAEYSFINLTYSERDIKNTQ